MSMYKGIGASSGIAIGKAFVLPAWEWDLPNTGVDVSDLACEFEKLYESIRISKRELENIKEDITDVLGEDQSRIFDAHLAILDDPIFMNEVEAIIQRQQKVAEVAVKEVVDKFVNMFDLLDDEYMKERALDIKDVGGRLLKNLLGFCQETIPPSDHPYILVAKELSPSQLAHLDSAQLLGIVTMMGGPTSHAAIMARAIGIPFVLGLEGKLDRPIHSGDMLILDGDEGTVFLNPDNDTVTQYHFRKQEWIQSRESLRQIAELPARTADGNLISLEANISSLPELEQALRNGAAGVGLFRTEFLYMNRSNLPKEEEQYEVYRQVAERLGDKPLIIRTLDIGGDKQLDYISLPDEDNPFLGYRAIRICLDRRDMFKTQLKAILRAGQHGNVKVMYPMISSVDELRSANEVLESAKNELSEEGKPFNPHMEVGIMIEVPAAVAIADLLAKEVRFFSIGTNDLVQFVLAVDRMNDHIAHLYDPFHPAIIRMLKQIVDAAHANGIDVAVCGEMAGDVRALPIWLGLGVRELSMSAQLILHVKSKLMQSREGDSREVLQRILTCKTSEEIKWALAEPVQQK